MLKTYREAGVNLDAAEAVVDRYRELAQGATRPEVIGGIGSFGGLFRLGNYRRPVLVAGTDGVGTKLRIAQELNRPETIGQDLVAMSVNDVLVHGAEPLFFLDYLGLGKLEPAAAAALVGGVAAACRLAGCALLGGETAELPGFYRPGEYELAGFAVGVVEEDRLIDGHNIKIGDRILGLGSSGLHSNGYSLARHLLESAGVTLAAVPSGLGESLGEALLRPTRIYVGSVQKLVAEVEVRGLCHITGGGLPGNLPRVLPPGTGAVLETGSWSEPPIFGYLRGLGVAEEEMRRVFNLGLGFLVIVDPAVAAQAAEILTAAGETVFSVGEITSGSGEVTFR